MPPRLLPTLAFLGLCAVGAALAAPAALADAGPAKLGKGAGDAVRASARRESLAVTAIRPVGPTELVVACGGKLGRDAFVKRASLVAFAAFRGQPTLETIVFEHADGAARQTIRVGEADLAAYLADRIPRAEYQRRLAYRASGPATPAVASARPAQPVVLINPAKAPAKAAPVAAAPRAATPLPPVPALPRTAAPVALPAVPTVAALPPAPKARGPVKPPAFPPQVVPIPDVPLPGTPHGERGGRPATAPAGLSLPVAEPVAAAPATPAVPAATDVTFAWSLGLGRAAYDAYTVEYDHALLPTLSVRPSLWILSGFSPINRLGGAGMDGLSGAVDLVGSTRQQVGPAGLALEGGLGLRATTLLAASGAYPAAHLRVGARWQALGLAMRYPLLTRGGDPTATWEASLGLAWSFGGPAAR